MKVLESSTEFWIIFQLSCYQTWDFFKTPKSKRIIQAYAIIPLFDPHANSLLTLVITLIPIGKKASKITRNLFHIK